MTKRPRPLVAVPAHRIESGGEAGLDCFGAPEPYLSAISRAGGAPVLVSPDTVGASDWLDRRDASRTLLSSMDALVLPGGRDVDASLYGQEQHSRSDAPDLERDALELGLALAALDMRLPTLAICRGLQVVNAALGGSLHQHLPEVTVQDHGTGGDALHRVRVDPASRLASVCGVLVEGCASHHHQGVERLGRGLVAVGWSDDGLVEALEARDNGEVPWFVAVQWHPERTAEGDRVQQALFDALVEAAPGPSGGVS
jgi:putative glutamine amidotransferase